MAMNTAAQINLTIAMETAAKVIAELEDAQRVADILTNAGEFGKATGHLEAAAFIAKMRVGNIAENLAVIEREAR